MAADFGIKVEIIPEEALQAEIDKIVLCLKNSGIEIETNIDEPGLGALIATLIRSIEKAIISAYEPIIALVGVVTEAIDAGLNAISVFVNKIVDVVEAIAELLSNLPLSIIEFIVNKILEPITKNINIPFPNVQGIIEIISGKVNLIDIDWRKWLQEGKLTIPQKLKDKGQEKIDQVMTLFDSLDGVGAAFLKILELLLFPLKFAIKTIESVLRKTAELAKNLFDAINEIVSLISNPVQFVLDFIAGIFADVLAPIIQKFVPNLNTEDIEAFVAKFKELISSIFAIGAIKINIDEWIEQLPPPLKAIFKQVGAFIKLIQCFIFWLVGLLGNPQTILNIFGLGGGGFKLPPVKSTIYRAQSRTFTITGISANNLSKLFKAGDKIIIEVPSRPNRDRSVSPAFTKEATIVSITGTTNPNFNDLTVLESILDSDLAANLKITKKI